MPLTLLDCVDFTSCNYDTKSFFFKRILTENPRNGVKNVLPMMDTGNGGLLKSSLDSLRQHLLVVFEAKNRREVAVYKVQKENSKSAVGGIFDTLYNVAKSTTSGSSSTTTAAKDPPEFVRCNPEEASAGIELVKPWKFSSLVLKEVRVFLISRLD